MTDNDIFQDVGDHFRSAVDTGLGDAETRRLRYHLVRLTTVGLTKEDVRDLGELGRLAFQESDVTKQVAKIKQRSDASPLAQVITSIVESAASSNFPVKLRAVMFGAVLGAYTAMRAPRSMDESVVAALGAIAGSVAVSTHTFLGERIAEQSWAQYLRMDE